MTHIPPHTLTPIFNLIDNAILRYREKVRMIQEEVDASKPRPRNNSPNPIALHYADKANQLLQAKSELEKWIETRPERQ